MYFRVFGENTNTGLWVSFLIASVRVAQGKLLDSCILKHYLFTHPNPINVIISWIISWAISWQIIPYKTERRLQFANYSRVPNKRTGHLLENQKNSHLYALIWDYSFINFHKKVPPIRLFPPILLFIFELSHPFFMLISLFSLWTYYVITIQKF